MAGPKTRTTGNMVRVYKKKVSPPGRRKPSCKPRSRVAHRAIRKTTRSARPKKSNKKTLTRKRVKRPRIKSSKPVSRKVATAKRRATRSHALKRRVLPNRQTRVQSDRGEMSIASLMSCMHSLQLMNAWESDEGPSTSTGIRSSDDYFHDSMPTTNCLLQQQHESQHENSYNRNASIQLNPSNSSQNNAISNIEDIDFGASTSSDSLALINLNDEERAMLFDCNLFALLVEHSDDITNNGVVDFTDLRAGGDNLFNSERSITSIANRIMSTDEDYFNAVLDTEQAILANDI